MPWHIGKHESCPASKPHAVIKDADGSVAGCHATKAEAQAQLGALYAKEPKGSAGMTDTIEMGGKPNPGTPKDKRLHENKCPDGQMPDGHGGCAPTGYQGDVAEHFGSSKSVSDKPWNGAASNFTDAQYQNAAAACDPASKGSVKERCFLPHHEPGGALSRAGLGAAAGRVGSLSGRSPAAVARAKAHLRSHYTQLGEKPPDSVAAALELAEDELALLDAPAEASPGPAHWSGTIVVEGVETGDHREFAADSLTWPDPTEVTLPLQWQKETGHGSDHDVTVAVGRIDAIARDGNRVLAEGRFDTHPDAVEAQRRMGEGMLNGVSILADDIADSEVEYVMPKADGEPEEEGDILSLLFAKPEKVIFHKARIRAATLCDVPAYVEATLHVVDQGAEAAPPLAASLPPSRPTPVHLTATSLEVWDGAAQEIKLRKFITIETARAAYAWVEGPWSSWVAKTQCRFLHHEITPSGEVGPASLSACSALLPVVHSARISEADKPSVYNHLAEHLRSAGEDPPPYEPQHALVAHAWQDSLWRPPAEWFRDPKLGQYTPILVSDAGRVWGHAVPWGECHIGFANECIMPPREAYHDKYLTGEQPLDDGSIVAVGLITAGIGHAPMHLKAGPAAEHYDNTEAVVAHVVTGNDRLGIWVAGGIVPWAQSERVQALRASGQVSPDWRRIGGRMRMVGLLTVNVSGYIVPRSRTLVADGQLQTLVASGLLPVHVGGPDLRREMDELAARVHG